MYFKINTPKVILESFEDEIVLVNLDNGNYYSIDKIGEEIWRELEKGSSDSDISMGIRKKYQGNLQEIIDAVQAFIEELQKEELILPAMKSEVGGDREPGEKEAPEANKEKSAFEPPVLHRYTDMQDLIMLDPIHEVDESGWPSVKPDSSPEEG